MPTDYDELVDRWRRISNVYYVSQQLHWDQMVVMPEGGAPSRAEQLAALGAVEHELTTDEAFGRLLEAAEDEALEPAQRAVIREIKRHRERAVAVPRELDERLHRTSSAAEAAWESAQADAEFDAVAPFLSDLRELTIERAEHIDPDRRPYAVMHDDSLPYIDLERVETLFDELRSKLVPLVDAVRESDIDPADPFDGTYNEATQRAVCEDLLDLVGFDRSRGRFDSSTYPLTLGTQYDARVTTRYDEADPLDAIKATLHEFGHAAYRHGLPDERYATPLGEPLGRGVDESQARYFENHVGRTRAFWDAFLPTMREHFPPVDDVSPEEAYAAVNRVKPDNCYRTKADELTYHLHVILRFEIEQELVGGDLAVEEIPHRWNELMDEYLGVTPDSVADGPLQVINWVAGFADFQSYTVGSLLAAQLDAAMRDALEVDGLIRDGEFEPIRDWLTEHVHRHGQRYPTDELVERATGEPLSAVYFLNYVEEKFGDLYAL